MVKHRVFSEHCSQCSAHLSANKCEDQKQKEDKTNIYKMSHISAFRFTVFERIDNIFITIKKNITIKLNPGAK